MKNQIKKLIALLSLDSYFNEFTNKYGLNHKTAKLFQISLISAITKS